MNEERCADGGRHVFAVDRQAIWIEDEGSYQLWGKCEKPGCGRSSWFVLTTAAIQAHVAGEPV